MNNYMGSDRRRYAEAMQVRKAEDLQFLRGLSAHARKRLRTLSSRRSSQRSGWRGAGFRSSSS
jgi:hypothetical protein